MGFVTEAVVTSLQMQCSGIWPICFYLFPALACALNFEGVYLGMRCVLIYKLAQSLRGHCVIFKSCLFLMTVLKFSFYINFITVTLVLSLTSFNQFDYDLLNHHGGLQCLACWLITGCFCDVYNDRRSSKRSQVWWRCTARK